MVDAIKNIMTIIGTIVVVFIVVVGLVLLDSWQSKNRSNKQQGLAVQAAPSVAGKEAIPPMVLTLSDLSLVDGFDTNIAKLYGKPKSARNASMSMSGYKHGLGQIRNVLFLNGENFSPHWLLQNNRSVVSSVKPIQNEVHFIDGEPKTRPIQPVLAFVYEVINTDSNDDDRLDHQDKRLVLATRPDGFGQTVLFSSVEEIVKLQLSLDEQYFSIIVRDETQLKLRKFALPNLSQQADVILVDFNNPVLPTEFDKSD